MSSIIDENPDAFAATEFMPVTVDSDCCRFDMFSYTSRGDIPPIADVIRMAAAICLAFSATSFAFSAVPERKFPPAI